MNVREITATIGLDFDGSGFKKAESALKSLKGTFAAVTGVLAAAKASLEALTFEVAKHGEHLGLMSDKLGVTTDDLQDLANAGKAAGVDLDSLGGALDGIQEKLIAASRVDKEAMLAFMRAGVSTHDAAGKMKPATDILRDLADQVQKQPNAARKMFVAQQLVGGASAEMVRLLSKGKKGIQEFSDEARGAGAVLSKDFIQQATKFNLEIRKAFVGLDGFKNAIATKVLPYMLKTIEAFNQWYKINGATIRTIASYASQTVMNGFSAIVNIVTTVVNTAKKLYDWLERLHPGFGKVAAGAAAAAIAFKALSALFAASPIGRAIVIITALATAFALAADDLTVFMEGGNSLFGDAVEWIGKLLGISNAAAKVRQTLKEVFDGGLAETIIDAFEHPLKYVGGLFGWLYETATAALSSLWDFVKDIGKKIGDFFTGGGGNILGSIMKLSEKIGDGIAAGMEDFAEGMGTGQQYGKTTNRLAGKIAGAVTGGGATSPSAAKALGAPAGPTTNISNVGGAANTSKVQQTNHVSITVNGGNPEEVTKAIDDYFGQQTQAAFAAGTPGVALTTGDQ